MQAAWITAPKLPKMHKEKQQKLLYNNKSPLYIAAKGAKINEH